ncbi:50S ribosomal protein L35 [Candidatus Peregrinibacteria bacterium CG10_big_fil_rev_8_21_14_0_10_36_19]|nr:MAG: 50S ribosomal protein L35 [Candidatus Peregrinibacteria bacterium CG10_big_fil_rev_8_21_14_0_10_36_19]
MMKHKTHSGAKKRFKVRKSGTVMAQKASKRHLLTNKSKRQKKSFLSGMPVTMTHMKALRRLLPGLISTK